MANPRKFSEKIALHTQKQAEETAAFEAILREVSATTRQGTQVQKQPQHLQLTQPNLGAYRGGSLPNVNQIGTNNSIDLQSALHSLEDMKQGPGRQSLVERLHRDRNRQIQAHRRPFPLDKRIDCSPYGSAYLSPPPDSSWRRTNSDSALHTSAMNQQVQNIQGLSTPPTNRRVDMVQGVEAVQQSMETTQDLGQSRPKSCEVPGINIYPSPEQDSGGVHIHISNNTGSLPDLTNLHFPSPLPTPLDVDDQGGYPQGGSPGNLSPTSVSHMVQVHPNQQTSPGTRRRQAQGGPTPLVLQGSPTQIPHNVTHQAGNCLEVNVAGDPLLDPCKYLPYLVHQTVHQSRPPSQLLQVPNQAAPSSQHLANGQQKHHHHQHQQLANNMPQPQLSSNTQMHFNVVDSVNKPQGAPLTHYRNSTSDCPQSPTSPLSQHSYSPSQSPGLPPTSLSSSPFDTYYMQAQQTNALPQQQFDQFTMVNLTLQDNPVTSNGVHLYSNNNGSGGGMVLSNLQYSQAGMNHVLSGSQEFVQSNHVNPYYSQSPQQPSSPQQQHSPQTSPSPQSHMSPQQIPPSPTQMDPQFGLLNNQGNNIPDIILTGADELSRQDFAKDIGNAMAGMVDAFDSELFPSDEALKDGLDPLDLDGLQMLTDPNMVTDPANEDSFRLDRL